MGNFKILFLYPNSRTESLIPPSITLLSRILKNDGFKVDLFDSSLYQIEGMDSDKIYEEFLTFKETEHLMKTKLTTLFKDLNQKVKKFNPDLIAVSATESTFLTAIDILKKIKNLEAPVVLGGIFATFAAERALQFKEIDFVCVGEGEETLLELCRKMKEGKDCSKITGLWMRDKKGDIIQNPIRKPVNLDDNPVNFDIALFDERRLYRPMSGKLYRMIPVETHRGCPYFCNFCNSPAQNRLYREKTKSNFFRKKSTEKIRQELLFYRDNFSAEYFFFWADTFLVMSDRELSEFCEMYSEIGLPFYISTRLETITENRLACLKKVGLNRVGFGIEHGNEQFRREVVGRNYSNKEAISKLKIPAKIGLQFSVNNIIGFPDETLELVMDTIELNRHIQFDTSSCSIFMPYYGTALRELAIKRGYIKPDVICPSNAEDSILEMPKFSRDRISGLRRVFAMYIKFPKSRWPEIRIAEQLTSKGDAKWRELREEFVAKFWKAEE